MDILKQLRWRYATKVFDPNRKISDEDFGELIEATRLSPSSYGLQLWKAIIVKNPETRKRLKEVAYNQPQITGASHLIVLATPRIMDEKKIDEFIQLISGIRSVSLESLQEYRKSMYEAVRNKSHKNEFGDWMARQAYLALGFLLETAALKNIDGCPMEGFDSKKFDDILELDKKGFESRVVCALGYRSEEDTYAGVRKVRFPKEEIFEEIN
jgi:nitroreductase